MINTRWIRRTMLGGFTLLACIGVGGVLANGSDHDRGNRHDDRDDQRRPPQVLKQGFESHRDLLRDARRGERGPEYSAWIVESSRFLNVPHRAFHARCRRSRLRRSAGQRRHHQGGQRRHHAVRQRLETTRLHLRLEHLVLLARAAQTR